MYLQSALMDRGNCGGIERDGMILTKRKAKEEIRRGRSGCVRRVLTLSLK